jgi:hypothetical protein
MGTGRMKTAKPPWDEAVLIAQAREVSTAL